MNNEKVLCVYVCEVMVVLSQIFSMLWIEFDSRVFFYFQKAKIIYLIIAGTGKKYRKVNNNTIWKSYLYS